MEKLILNCDLGENESAELTGQAINLIDAANICCGYHAGSAEKTRATVRLAMRRGCLIGAHPGLPVAGGRGRPDITADVFRALLVEQMGQFMEIVHSEGASMQYIKLHGSLYHAVEKDAWLAEAYLAYLKAWGDARIGVFALAGGEFASMAASEGIHVYQEVFIDRAYTQDGHLLSRELPNAVLDVKSALQRFRSWREAGEMASVDGESFRLHGDTLCVHADSVGSLEMLRSIREIMHRAIAD